MVPSSSFASSLKPNVAYRDLNLAALWKKQMILPALARSFIASRSSSVNPSYDLPAEAVRLADFWLSLMAGSSLRVLGLMTSCKEATHGGGFFKTDRLSRS